MTALRLTSMTERSKGGGAPYAEEEADWERA